MGSTGNDVIENTNQIIY